MNDLREHIEARLDEALAESFPASDPPAVTLRDEPPAVPRIEDPAERPTSSFLKRALTSGAIAAAGVVITRMILRRTRHPRTPH
jgi:hypothetical protein